MRLVSYVGGGRFLTGKLVFMGVADLSKLALQFQKR